MKAAALLAFVFLAHSVLWASEATPDMWLQHGVTTWVKEALMQNEKPKEPLTNYIIVHEFDVATEAKVSIVVDITDYKEGRLLLVAVPDE